MSHPPKYRRLIEARGIRILDLGPDYLRGRRPDERWKLSCTTKSFRTLREAWKWAEANTVMVRRGGKDVLEMRVSGLKNMGKLPAVSTVARPKDMGRVASAAPYIPATGE